ncbi:hypothetical protein [Thiorhodospira sibirica]|uniref:hypothetical protein n=1 Tax=Thiorhodospira sibirica TaxID=154347 RepID=UPI0005949658|nr:hypothetical protein [Thiorhodospira sibirica]
MAVNLPLRPAGRTMSTFSKIPWTLTIILYMVVVHFINIDMSGVAGYIFLVLCLVVLFFEFFKSGDVNEFAFLIDILSAVFALVVATVLMSYMIFALKETPTFFHWFGCAVILIDAVLSPFNSFRTALRNFGLGSPV